MENAPKVEIKFLVDYELEATATSALNSQGDIMNFNQDRNFKGKKGFHLCGGSVDETTGEVSGCLLDGTYTLYGATSGSYDGFIGNELSGADYTFSSPQYVALQVKNSGTFIKSLLIYFDTVANEYATEIYFADAIKEDGTTDSRYTSSYVIKNNKTLFMYSFGEDSDIVSIKVYFKKWSKKNAFAKFTKIKTGYTGLYDYKTLQSLKWDNDMFTDPEEMSFGISSTRADIEINDVDDVIDELYAKNLIFQNVEVRIYIDDIYQGSFYIDTKENERGSDIWVFECIDYFEIVKDDIVPIMQLDDSGTCSLTKIISWATVGKGFEVEYSAEALAACNAFLIPQAYIKSQQTLYDVLLKVCQVGLLRMYISKTKLRIVRGV